MKKVIVALAVVLFTASQSSAQSAWADKLFGGTTSHDFGNVPRGAQLKHAFNMTNIYKEPLTLTEIRISCGCLTATPTTKTIQPGESATLNIHMDAKQFVGLKTIKIYVSVGPKFVSTATLTVSANARQDVVFNPGEIDFGVVPRGQTPRRQIEVEYAGAFDWKVLEIVKNQSAPFELAVEELPRQVSQFARRGYRIFATLKADAPAGPFKQDVVLKTNETANSVLVFQIVGNVQAALSAVPQRITFSMKVGETATKRVIVRGQRQFRIVGIDGLDAEVESATPTNSDQSHVLTFNVRPARAGEFRRNVVIRTDLGNETVVIPIEGDVAP